MALLSLLAQLFIGLRIARSADLKPYTSVFSILIVAPYRLKVPGGICTAGATRRPPPSA